MSARTPKSPQQPQDLPPKKLTEVAAAAVMVAQPPAHTPLAEEELKQEIALALAAQGGVKANNLWDELNKTHDDSVGNITKIGHDISGQLIAFTQDPQRRAQVEPWRAKRLAKLITQFEMDTAKHLDNLDKIQEVHKDHAGGVGNDPDEFMQVVSLQGDYATQHEVHYELTMPQVTEMLEITGAVELTPAPTTIPAANDSEQQAQA